MKVMPDQSRLTVALLVGTAPATDGTDHLHCGVRDYARCLAQALSMIGIEAPVIAPQRWGLHDGLPWLRALRQVRPDIVHLQYPAIGHRYSLLPHLLGLAGVGRRCVVTLHEHSALPRVQQMANQLFRATAHRLIFTTEYEAKAYGAAADSPIIPIGSNVPVHSGDPERDDTVLYFGQIRPGKGIEQFISLAKLSAAANQPWRFVIMGSAPPRWRDYRQALQAETPPTLRWADDTPLNMVAAMMARATAAYLPFPDGAGLRRGSLIAALANGLPVIAPTGPSTTEALHSVLFPAATPEAALEQISQLRATPTLARQRSDRGRCLAQQRDWQTIANQHANLYHDMLDVRSARSDQKVTA